MKKQNLLRRPPLQTSTSYNRRSNSSRRRGGRHFINSADLYRAMFRMEQAAKRKRYSLMPHHLANLFILDWVCIVCLIIIITAIVCAVQIKMELAAMGL